MRITPLYTRTGQGEWPWVTLDSSGTIVLLYYHRTVTNIVQCECSVAEYAIQVSVVLSAEKDTYICCNSVHTHKITVPWRLLFMHRTTMRFVEDSCDSSETDTYRLYCLQRKCWREKTRRAPGTHAYRLQHPSTAISKQGMAKGIFCTFSPKGKDARL